MIVGLVDPLQQLVTSGNVYVVFNQFQYTNWSSIGANATNEAVTTLRQLLQRIHQNDPVYNTYPDYLSRLERLSSNESVYSWPSGDTYQGQFQNGLPHGVGKYTGPTRTLIGDWEENTFSGYGRESLSVCPNSNSFRVYEGTFLNGSKHGYGRAITVAGGESVGEWNSGSQHGYARAVLSDGSTYEGQWKHGQPHGNGVLSYSRTDRYDGEFEDGTQHGYGTRTYVTGEVYEGLFHKNMYHGYGVFTWPNGEKYEGYWVNGKRNGYGMEMKRSGEVREAMWKDDVIHTIINDQRTMPPSGPPSIPLSLASPLTSQQLIPLSSMPGASPIPMPIQLSSIPLSSIATVPLTSQQLIPLSSAPPPPIPLPPTSWLLIPQVRPPDSPLTHEDLRTAILQLSWADGRAQFMNSNPCQNKTPRRQ
jgi:hypothetical protein